MESKAELLALYHWFLWNDTFWSWEIGFKSELIPVFKNRTEGEVWDVLMDVFYLSMVSSAVRVADAELEALGALGLRWGDKSGFAQERSLNASSVLRPSLLILA